MKTFHKSAYEKIITYSNQNKILNSAPHCLYGIPHPDADLDNIDFIVMGMNPGESSRYTKSIPGYFPKNYNKTDFENEVSNRRNKVSWASLMQEMCETPHLVQTEAFFWSSKNTKAAFVERFGAKPKSSQLRQHFHFCAELNRDLIRLHKPRAVVFTGLTWMNFVSKIYNLKPTTILKMPDEPSQKIAIVCEDTLGLDWVFTPHWTSARGMTKQRKEEISKFIVGYLNRPKRPISF